MATSEIPSIHELPINVSVSSSVTELNDVCAEISRAIVARMANSNDVVSVVGVWQNHWNFGATMYRRNTSYVGFLFTAGAKLITWTYNQSSDTVTNATERW